MAKSKPASNDNYVVPTNQLADILSPVFDRLSVNSDHANPHADAWGGAHDQIVNDVARFLDQQEHSVPRRIYAIRKREQISTSLDIADAFLLSVDILLSSTDLPVLPASERTAQEQVRTHYPEMTEEEQESLARSLFHFSTAYLRESADPHTIELVDENRHKSNIRRANKKRRDREAVAT
jgi:hypothetical protein